MRTRIYDWLDIETKRRYFSFQIYFKKQWRNVHNNGTPLIFETANERDMERKSFSKRKEADYESI